MKKFMLILSWVAGMIIFGWTTNSSAAIDPIHTPYIFGQTIAMQTAAIQAQHQRIENKPVTLAAATATLQPATKKPTEYIAGKDYTVISPDVLKKESIKQLFSKKWYQHKILVIEFFSYGCPGCNNFQPYWQGWSLLQNPEQVAITRIPAVFEPGWMSLAKLFYAVSAIGLERPLSNQIFDAIHHQGVNLQNDQQIKDFMKAAADKGNATDPTDAVKFNYQEFLKYFDQPDDKLPIKQWKQIFIDFKVTSTPSVVINGKYLAELNNRIVTPEQLADLVNFLVNKELSDKKATESKK